jgi:hypothetical protein
MFYGELGIFPSELQTKIKMICFWYKLVASEDKLSVHTSKMKQSHTPVHAWFELFNTLK